MFELASSKLEKQTASMECTFFYGMDSHSYTILTRFRYTERNILDLCSFVNECLHVAKTNQRADLDDMASTVASYAGLLQVESCAMPLHATFLQLLAC